MHEALLKYGGQAQKQRACFTLTRANKGLPKLKHPSFCARHTWIRLCLDLLIKTSKNSVLITTIAWPSKNVDAIHCAPKFSTITFMLMHANSTPKWPCAIRSCHNRDMPKISSKYAFVHLQWHNLESVHPTIAKLYILESSFFKESKNGFIFVVEASLKTLWLIKKLKFC